MLAWILMHHVVVVELQHQSAKQAAVDKMHHENLNEEEGKEARVARRDILLLHLDSHIFFGGMNSA